MNEQLNKKPKSDVVMALETVLEARLRAKYTTLDQMIADVVESGVQHCTLSGNDPLYIVCPRIKTIKPRD